MLAMAAAAVAGCRKKKPRSVPAMTTPPPQGWSETGIASWYGHPYHGRRAANGEVYDMERMTAAHRTLPFNTMVRVQSLTNGKQTVVRITDRGPFIEGRIIDLSRAAARELDLIGPGIMRVRIEVAGGTSRAERGGYAVQAGAFVDKSRAERLLRSLRKSYAPVRLVAREGSGVQWRVLVGEKPSLQEAEALASQLRAEGVDGFVVRLDPSLE